MKKILLSSLSGIFFILSATPVFSAETIAASCHDHPVFIQGVGRKKAEKAWIKVLHSFDANLPDGLSNELSKPRTVKNMYQADINNDGQIETVFVLYSSGTMGNVDLEIFRETNGQWFYLKDLPKPADEGDGPWYFLTYQENNQDQFLARLCDKTYMLFDKRKAYVWQNGTINNACDVNWLNNERQTFQKLENTKSYDRAYAQLNAVMARCADNIDPVLNRWLQNDLALAAFNNGNAKKCNEILTALESDQTLTTIPQALQQSISVNHQLCAQAAKQADQLDKPWGKKEYAWLLHRVTCKAKSKIGY